MSNPGSSQKIQKKTEKAIQKFETIGKIGKGSKFYDISIQDLQEIK